MKWVLLVFSCFAASFVWTLVSVLRNYILARKIGFPIIISPAAPLNPFYIIFQRSVPSALTLLGRLPFGFGTWAKCTYMGWPFDDKHALHERYGPIFTITTPGGNEVTVADADATHGIFQRRKEFIKPAVMYDQLNVFGPNVNTVEGKDWERQRRLTAPSFNEKTSAAVWDEAQRQTQSMADAWLDEGQQGTFETVADTATLALHVLTSVGFGIAYPFKGGVRQLPDGHVMTYRDALSLCLQNIVTFAIFPKRFLSFSLLPRKLKNVGVAVQEFQKHMEELLSHERGLVEERNSSQMNLISSMIRASDDPQDAGEKDRPSATLANEEIYGNIFAFNLAGHETTANTVAVALVLLAAKPNYQDWIAQEIDRVYQDSKDYAIAFPKLKRCLAIMYETLRLHGSIVFIPKSTGFHSQVIELDGKRHFLPPNTAVNINVEALHTDPKSWGNDALEWKPDRWLVPTDAGHEAFIEPAKGSYVPWADGPRVCLGRKFSQVEFVGVLFKLFSQYKVLPAVEEFEKGRETLMEMVNEMAISYTTLQMLQPKKVALSWEKR